MILADWMIERLAESGMIHPFAKASPPGVLSYGLTSFGYDFRLARGGMRRYSDEAITPTAPTHYVDPKRRSTVEASLVDVPDPAPRMPYILIPHATYLGYTVERFIIPTNVMAVTVGKSTYARCGILLNVTPAEPEWAGHLTLEISNLSDVPVAVYPDEGIGQMMFFSGMMPDTTYADKNGKYQDQKAQVVLPSMGGATLTHTVED